MYFKYGDYKHADNSVAMAAFRQQPIRSSRGRRMLSRYTMECSGDLKVADGLTTPIQVQNDLNAKMADMEAAYSIDYQDAGFFRDNGTVTQHFFQNDAAANMTGNMVDYFAWMPGDGEQYAQIRSFRFSISCEFLDAYNNITDYTDTISKIGTAGPIREWVTMPNGVVLPRQVTVNSVQRFLHRGSATALATYPIPPSPLASGANYLEHLTQITYRSPKKYGGFARWAEYTTTWAYVYEFDTNQSIFPLLL